MKHSSNVFTIDQGLKILADMEKDMEAAGEGDYNDNGTILTVGAGDVTFVASGEGHSIRNTGEGDLEFIALILYK